MKDYVSPPINQDWVREELALAGTTCEWPGCAYPAVFAWEGRTSIAYLCGGHKSIVLSDPRRGRVVEDHLYMTFRRMYDFILRNHESGGKLLADLEQHELKNEQHVKDAERENKAAERRAVSAATKELKTAHAQPGVVGQPDDELATSRGVQSPSWETPQLVFRPAEPKAEPPVSLTPVKEPVLLTAWLL